MMARRGPALNLVPGTADRTDLPACAANASSRALPSVLAAYRSALAGRE